MFDLAQRENAFQENRLQSVSEIIAIFIKRTNSMAGRCLFPGVATDNQIVSALNRGSGKIPDSCPFRRKKSTAASPSSPRFSEKLLT